MPSTGTPADHTLVGARGASPSVTLFGPPERMIPAGANLLMNDSGTSKGWISQYTFSSRTRRAMSWVYWAPKSRIRMEGCVGDENPKEGGGGEWAYAPRGTHGCPSKRAAPQPHRDPLQQRADKE